MPRYEYVCPSNGQVVEVEHPMAERLTTWGEVCKLAWIPVGDTAADAPVERRISAPNISTPDGPSDLRAQGFRKLVRRGEGIYEDVTATSGEGRFIERDEG